jgi:hypothetical protein
LEVTDTEDGIREFARVTPAEVTPELARFMAAMRRLQDIAVSTSPDETVWNDTAALIEDVCARLEQSQGAGRGSARRARSGPSGKRPSADAAVAGGGVRIRRGDDARALHPLPRRRQRRGARWRDPAVLRLAFRHGGLRCWRRDSRTAYLHVDYRKVTPTDEPLLSRAWIDYVDGRKLFVRAAMTDADGNVLSEASGLMLKLLPHDD